MLLFRGADEAVERDVQPLIHCLEAAGVALGKIGRQHALALCGLNHLQAMLVGAGQKEHILAIETLKARQRVGRDRFISVADMRHTIGIGDRGRDVEGV